MKFSKKQFLSNEKHLFLKINQKFSSNRLKKQGGSFYSMINSWERLSSDNKNPLTSENIINQILNFKSQKVVSMALSPELINSLKEVY